MTIFLEGWTNIYTFLELLPRTRLSGVISLSHHKKKFPESSELRAIVKNCVCPGLSIFLGISESLIALITDSYCAVPESCHSINTNPLARNRSGKRNGRLIVATTAYTSTTRHTATDHDVVCRDAMLLPGSIQPRLVIPCHSWTSSGSTDEID